jgi:hypothetical protein
VVLTAGGASKAAHVAACVDHGTAGDIADTALAVGCQEEQLKTCNEDGLPVHLFARLEEQGIEKPGERDDAFAVRERVRPIS